MSWLAKHSALAWVLSIGLALAGLVIALGLPSGIYPEVEFPRIVVVAKSGDAPPDVTLLALARPLENELATVLGMERIRSRTIRGATELSLQFAPGTDMWHARQMVEARVNDARATLPADTELIVEPVTTTSFPVITFNLSGDVDPKKLNELGELVVRPALSRIRGVGRVEVLGGDVREVEVILDPLRAAALNLSPAKVAETLRANTVLQAVGRMNDAHALMTISLSSEITAREELASIPIAVGPDGSPIPLRAIAEIEEGAQDRLLRVAGREGETVLVSVSRLPGASTSDVVARVRAEALAIEKTLPPAVKLAPVYDQALLVDESIRAVRDAILIGIALCVAVIALFLRDVRGGLIAAAAVPLTLGITFIPIALLGESLNLMSAGGLAVAIGLVIDDAIVVVEAIKRKLEQGSETGNAAVEGTRELLGALIGTTATTVVVFVPLAGLRGVVGKFFTALAATLSGAVIISLAIAVFVVPLAASRFMRPPLRTPDESAEEPWFVRAYLALLEPVLRRPAMGIIVALGLLALGVLGARTVGTGFLPVMDEGAFVLDYFLPAGSSLEDTDAAARKLEAILKDVPDVETYSRRTGAELGPAAATQVNSGDIMVRLKPSGERDKSTEEIIAETRAALAERAPELRGEFVQVLQDVLNDLAGNPHPIEIKIFGDDYRVLEKEAEDIAERIKDVEGLVDLYPGFDQDAPELRLRVDPAATARMQTTAEELAKELDAALHGVVVSEIKNRERPIGIRVRYPDNVRFDAGRIGKLPIWTGSGRHASLDAVTHLERAGVSTERLRENLRPVVIVSADIEERDLGSVVRDVREKLREVRIPEGQTIELGGSYESQQATFRELATVMALGLLCVLAVLLAQFRRARLAVVILASIPLALVGALVTLALTGIPLNASSLMGCVLLIGLVVKNGILLLEQAEKLFDAGGDAGGDAEASLTRASVIRLRPILMTTVATVAGLLPLALGWGAGSEVQRPLAVAVIGGLVVSTLVSLILLPAFARSWALKRTIIRG